jgi:monovalent cation:H+ antiporter-2, CPA2 family
MSGVAVLGGLVGGGSGVALAVGGVVALTALALLTARWIAPFAFTKLGLDDEQKLLVVLSTLFLFVGAAHLLGLSPAVGAFFAGIGFSRFPVSGLVRAEVSSFADFFVATFYVSLGAVLVVPSLETLWMEASLVVTLSVLAPLLLWPIARSGGLTTRSALEAVTLLAQCGELALVVGIIGLTRGDVSERMFGVIATVAVVTMFIAPLLSSDRVVLALVRYVPRGRRLRREEPAHDHVLWIGAGSASRPVIERLHAQRAPLLVVEDDPSVVAALEEQGVRVLRGDGADVRVLRAAGIAHARLVISTMRRASDNERLIHIAGQVPVWVRVFSAEAGARFRELGARVLVESEAGLERFLRWFEERGDHPPGAAS